jgi:hypothetical protein
MSHNFKSIGEILNSEPKLSKLKKVIKSSDVLVEFGKIFPEFDKIANAKKVEHNVLHLVVENAAWRNELQFRQKEIIDKINNHFKENRVTAVRLLS